MIPYPWSARKGVNEKKLKKFFRGIGGGELRIENEGGFLLSYSPKCLRTRRRIGQEERRRK